MFDEVVADPPEAVLLRCVEHARAARVDLVIGLGGGSSMDIAKLAAVLVVSEQPLAEMYGIGNVKGARVPLVQMPTTAGTGSEVTNISIVSVGETTKMGIVAPQLYADRVILDAELTVGLPRQHTAATGIDAMVHAIEAYTSKHKKNAISDARTVTTGARARQCCLARRSRAKPLPMRRLRLCMRWRIRWVGISISRTVCRTR